MEERLPPHSIEAEQAVLGSVLFDEKSWLDISELDEADFYRKTHRKIFAAMLNLVRRSISVDIVMLSEELSKKGDLEEIGGSYYLTELQEQIVSIANVRQHMDIVLEKARLRHLLNLSKTMVGEVYSGQSSDRLIESTVESMYSISKGERENIYHQNFYELRRKQLNERVKRTDEYFPKSGWEELDDMLVYGFRGFVLIAGRPSRGKTDIKCNLIDHWLDLGIGVYDWSPEMGADRELDRMDSVHLPEVSNVDLFRGTVSDPEVKEKIRERWRWYDTKKYWLDTSVDSFTNLYLKIKMHKEFCPELKIACFDLFGDLKEVMNATRDRTAILSGLISQIANAAKELDVCFVVLHQLSRKLEDRKSARPRMADLADCSQFEKAADLIFFCSRPALDDKTCFDLTTHMVVGKQRDGGRHMGRGVRLELVGDHKFVCKGTIEEEESTEITL